MWTQLLLDQYSRSSWTERMTHIRNLEHLTMLLYIHACNMITVYICLGYVLITVIHVCRTNHIQFMPPRNKL